MYTYSCIPRTSLIGVFIYIFLFLESWLESLLMTDYQKFSSAITW